jgi:hypothetical protein
MNPTIQITELDKKFVVFKRVKKESWYYRGRVVTSRSARKATLFATKAEADAKVKELNLNRKAYRFRTETADKHFVNTWSVRVDAYSGGVSIANGYIALTDVIKKQVKVNTSLNIQKPSIVKTIDDQLARVDREIADADASYKRTLETAAAELQLKKQRIADRTVGLMNTKSYIERTDFDTDFVEKYQTQLDKKTQILFGAKT